MDPVTIGGDTVSHAATDPYYLRQGAIQYEVGTPPIAQAIGWAGAIEYMESLGMNHVFEHAETMTPFAVHALHGVEGLTIWGDHSKPGGAGGLVSFSLSNVPPAQIGTACGMLGVAIRSGGHCGIAAKRTRARAAKAHTRAHRQSTLRVHPLPCTSCRWPGFKAIYQPQGWGRMESTPARFDPPSSTCLNTTKARSSMMSSGPGTRGEVQNPTCYSLVA